jgi:hypothetical protein
MVKLVDTIISKFIVQLNMLVRIQLEVNILNTRSNIQLGTLGFEPKAYKLKVYCSTN